MNISALTKQAKTYLPNLNGKRLREAFEFAKEAHEGQTRLDGSPYLIHPFEAAMNLLNLHVDEETLIAALLHDVPEDTEYTLKDVEKKFGKKVAFLVDGVTKLAKVKYRDNMAERQIESLKKFFLHSAQDLRIILIKLADRLHNMNTLEYVPKTKQLRIARETMEIYVPIANLLGVWEFKSSLEDLCFKYIYPKEFSAMEKRMERSAPKRKKLLKETTSKIKRALKEHAIHADIQARPKSLYSTFRKMMKSGKRLQDLYDLLALRIIVDDCETCYRVLGIIHSLFRPRSGRIKDYIAVPKSNGYQSLHTTVFGIDGAPTEFQIRTQQMHIESEYGIAAHYFYKQSHSLSSKAKKEIEKRSAWVQNVLELQKELKNNFDFIENLKLDVFKDRIFIFTPQGDVIDLPNGANGIDFAYHIHTSVGDHAVALYRNGKRCPLTTTLATGDTVQVITSEEQKLPKREWLSKAKTNLGKNKIRVSLRRQSDTESYSVGKKFMVKLLHRYGCDEMDTLTKTQKEKLVTAFETDSWHDFLERFGNGNLSDEEIIQTLYTTKELLGKPHHTGVDYRTEISGANYKGDHTFLSETSKREAVPYYHVHLAVETDDRVGLLRDLGMQLANLNVNIHEVSVRSLKKGIAIIDLVVEVIDLDQLRYAFDAVESVVGVRRVHRLRNDSTPATKKSRGKSPAKPSAKRRHKIRSKASKSNRS